jgi:hypothetical protein
MRVREWGELELLASSSSSVIVRRQVHSLFQNNSST